MKIMIAILTASILSAGDYYYSFGQKVQLQEIKNARSGNTKFYLNAQSKRLGVNNTLIVSFKRNVDENLKKYNLEVVEDLQNGMLLVSTKDDVLSVCSKLYESSDVHFAEPNFLRNRTKRVADPLYPKAWHLHDTATIINAHISVEEAWKTTKGSGIKIAVFDDAVDSNHEDFSVVAQLNAVTNEANSLPDTSDDAHGTFVAGIAVAKENSLGSVGVAPEAQLLAIKGAVGATSTDAGTIRAFNWAKEQGAAVMNNSWGGYAISEPIRTAIEDAANNGRGGKGMVIVFGHGNDNCKDSDATCYKDGDKTTTGLGKLQNDESSLDFVLAVGATNQKNKRASYSNYGQYLDICAPGGDGDTIEEPSGMVSTDISGDLGWSKTEYVNKYGESVTGDTSPNYISNDYSQVGTSYAAPVVAGVAALVISANPNLTRAEVFDVLQTTADKVGDYTYTNGRSYELGYGKVNAAKAVNRAVELLNTSTTATTTSSTTTTTATLNILPGWNLLSSPINAAMPTAKLNAVAKKEAGGTAITWILKKDGSNWEQVGLETDLEPNRGIWVLADSAATVSFDNLTPNTKAFSISENVQSLVGTNFMLGTPIDASLQELTEGANSVWVYDNPNNNWIGYHSEYKGVDPYDKEGYYRGNATTAVKAGTGYYYIKQN